MTIDNIEIVKKPTISKNSIINGALNKKITVKSIKMRGTREIGCTCTQCTFNQCTFNYPKIEGGMNNGNSRIFR